MIFFGLGEAFRTGTHKAIILDYLELNNMLDRKLEYYGTTRSWSQIGAALSSLIAGILVFYSNNYDYIFIASIIPYITGFILILTYPEYEKTCENRCFSMHIKSFYSEIFSKKIGKIVINSAFFEAVFKSVKDYIQPVIKSAIPVLFAASAIDDTRKTALFISVFYFIIYILSSFSSKNVNKTLNRFKISDNHALNLSFVFFTISVIFAGLVNIKVSNFTLWLTVIIFMMLYIIYNFRKPVIVSFYGKFMDKSHRAGVLSVDSQVKSVILMICAPLLGFLVDSYGIGYGMSIFGVSILFLSFLVKFKD